MINLLTPEQRASRRAFREFADEQVAPRADDADREQGMSREVVKALAAAGYLGATTPLGRGDGMDMVTYGLLAEELGRTCQSVRNFVAVQDMVAHAVSRAGTPEQRERWLPRLAAGETLAAFALTEPGVGSDAGGVEMTVTAAEGRCTLRGRKKWISFGQVADIFLTFARWDGKHTAFLVERDTPGLTVRPIGDLLGLRGSLLAELVFDDSPVPAENVLGRPGGGMVFVASAALNLGRYSTAWGAVGLAQACLEESAWYAGRREQYGTAIKNHQLVRKMLADMLTETTAARLLCYQAGVGAVRGDADSINQTLMAKYWSSVVANRVASDAVQIHGAQGVGAETAIQRHYRDAKVLEIIEGTTQIQQSIIGQFCQTLANRARPRDRRDHHGY